MEKIRFRKPMYTYGGKFEKFMFWGPLSDGFESPGTISGCKGIEDEQFIGITDMNGFEIFEGDICEIIYTDWPSNSDPNIKMEDYLTSISHIGSIEYHSPEYGIMLKDRYGDLTPHTLRHGTHGRIKIIGNIHLTPKLNPEKP
jgi:hypothetical protein